MGIADGERLIYEYRLEREIRRVYEEARDDIDAKIEEFNRKFKIKEQIHLKDVSEGRWTQEQYDAWLRGQVFQSDQWISKKRQIEETLFNANSIATKMVNDQRTGLFSFNANYQAYMLEHTAGVNFGFQLYDSATVARLIKDNPQVLPQWKIDEPKDYLWNGRIVNNAIRQGIIQGERLDQIAKRLSDGLVTQNKNKMLTFARTGMTEAQNAGRQTRLLEAEGMGIKVHKEWMATLDEHTRWQHADLDGQKQPVDKPFKIDMYTIRYPGDPQAHPSMVYNCRCTLVGDLDDYPSEYERYDNINGVPIENMTYREWEKAKGVSYSKSRIPDITKFSQVSIGSCRSVEEVNKLLNTPGLFKREIKSNMVLNTETLKWERKDQEVLADLTGCDLDSAKAIAASYQQVFEKYPQLMGKFYPPDSHPVDMKENTYAWCKIRNNGKVQVNTSDQKFGNWRALSKQYDSDVLHGFHPYGTTAESIVVHEIGHGIDGLLAREGILGGTTSSGEYRYASSSMKSTVMKRAASMDYDNVGMYFDVWGNKEGMQYAVNDLVSTYATENNQEWFAECFAEYITSANPRIIATEFGKELERLLSKLK